MPERLRDARRKVVGVKETMKAVQNATAMTVYVAADAEQRIVRPLQQAAIQAGIELVSIESMRLLGRLCAIDVGAAAAALLKDNVPR